MCTILVFQTGEKLTEQFPYILLTSVCFTLEDIQDREAEDKNIIS